MRARVPAHRLAGVGLGALSCAWKKWRIAPARAAIIRNGRRVMFFIQPGLSKRKE
jgi:hypothetical protein